MGTSNTYRKGPGWQGNNTNRGSEPAVSEGAIVRPEGTHMSGSNETNSRFKSSVRTKSKSSRESVKTKGPHGES